MNSRNTHYVGPGEVAGLEVKHAIGRVLTPYGCQVVDTWGFLVSSDIEYLSMVHNHTALYRIRFKVGGTLVSNKLTPLLRLKKDTTDGFHDSFHAVCSMGSYSFLVKPMTNLILKTIFARRLKSTASNARLLLRHGIYSSDLL
jgi:uncharacterized protein YcgI (DUF1989 family)